MSEALIPPPDEERMPSARAPRRLYWLDIITIGKLRYRQKGGGKFTHKAAALAQQDPPCR